MLRIVRWALEGLSLVTAIGLLVGTLAFFELAALLQYKDKLSAGLATQPQLEFSSSPRLFSA